MQKSKCKIGKLLSVGEVAHHLSINRFTAYRLIYEGKIPVVKLGRQWRVSEADLAEFIRGRLTIYGLTAVKPFLYRIEVLEKYRHDRQKYYLFDEPFSGRLGNKKDYYYRMQGRPPKEGDFSEIRYHKLPPKNERTKEPENQSLVVLGPREFRKIANCPEEQNHWMNFLTV